MLAVLLSTTVMLMPLGAGLAAGDEKRASSPAEASDPDLSRGDRMLHPDNGLPDQVAVLRWYLAAAQRGDPSAAGRLGALYLRGKGGVERDFARARFWLHRGAMAGDPRAQFDLGVIYTEALGTGYDWPRARYWLRLAARNGSREAARYLGRHAPRRPLRR